MPTYSDQPIVVGDTIDFKLHARKDRATWDLTGATVSLYLKNPSGIVSAALSATITDATAGIADYTTTTELDEDGDWVRQWKVVSGAVTLWSEEIEFSVLPNVVT